MQFSPTMGVFFTNVQKANIIAFIKTNFLAPILSVKKHPLHVFCFLPLFACLDFLKLFHLPIFGEFFGSMQKISCFWLLHPCYNFPTVNWLTGITARRCYVSHLKKHQWPGLRWICVERTFYEICCLAMDTLTKTLSKSLPILEMDEEAKCDLVIQ